MSEFVYPIADDTYFKKLDVIELAVLKAACLSNHDGFVFTWSDIKNNLEAEAVTGEINRSYSPEECVKITRGVEASVTFLLNNFCFCTHGRSINNPEKMVNGYRVAGFYRGPILESLNVTY